tara:strand:+ start:416 stop:793 length:378 start_codon:yes stop_codon:yes gene_type:complete
MLNNLKPINIADKITSLSAINVFSNTRQRKVVEVRSLLTYLLRDKLKMRWKNIVLFYVQSGKEINMANVMHSYKKYSEYKKNNPKLIEFENEFVFKSDDSYDVVDRISYLEKKCKRLEKKLLNQK